MNSYSMQMKVRCKMLFGITMAVMQMCTVAGKYADSLRFQRVVYVNDASLPMNKCCLYKLTTGAERAKERMSHCTKVILPEGCCADCVCRNPGENCFFKKKCCYKLDKEEERDEKLRLGIHGDMTVKTGEEPLRVMTKEVWDRKTKTLDKESSGNIFDVDSHDVEVISKHYCEKKDYEYVEGFVFEQITVPKTTCSGNCCGDYIFDCCKNEKQVVSWQKVNGDWDNTKEHVLVVFYTKKP